MLNPVYFLANQILKTLFLFTTGTFVPQKAQKVLLVEVAIRNKTFNFAIKNSKWK